MDAAEVLRRCRSRSGHTLRSLAEAAGTSHSTLSAYESASKVPTVATLDRIVRAAGFALDAELAARRTGTPGLSRGDELAAVLRLAGTFPARHEANLAYPPFPTPASQAAASTEAGP